MLSSNIAGIIGTVKRMQASIPAAAARAADAEYWRPRLYQAALETLRAQWALEKNVALRRLYEALTPRLAATLTAAVLPGGGSRFTMGVDGSNGNDGKNESGPLDLRQVIEENAEGRTGSGKASKNFRLPQGEPAQRRQRLEAAREGLLEWVRTEKRKETQPGGRDAGLTDEAIAQRLEYILGLGDSVKEATAERDAAAESLLPVIQAWLDENPWVAQLSGLAVAGPAVPPETVSEWLGAVLAAWVALLELSLPRRWQREFERAVGRAGTELV